MSFVAKQQPTRPRCTPTRWCLHPAPAGDFTRTWPSTTPPVLVEAGRRLRLSGVDLLLLLLTSLMNSTRRRWRLSAGGLPHPPPPRYTLYSRHLFVGESLPPRKKRITISPIGSQIVCSASFFGLYGCCSW